jgi:hypothetical protein
MRKLRLDLDALEVDTFETLEGSGDPRRTVQGNQIGGDPQPVEPVESGGSDCRNCHFTLIPTCMSCGEEVCTPASYSECPEGCFPSYPCAVVGAEPVRL